MSSAPLFRPSLLAARERLAEGRRRVRQQHEAGSPGIQVCAHLTDLVDSVLLDLYEAALVDVCPGGAEELREQVALVPHGGYGRRDLAPYSDVDLMILHVRGAEEQVASLAKRLLRDVFDVGLELGHSVRTTEQACHWAARDATVCTSLVESRLLTGNAALYETFSEKFKRKVQSCYRPLLAAMEKARREERAQFGETIYLLEPNVKRSRGGLRDIQLLRWIGFARYGMADLDNLQLLSALTKEEQRALREAQEFLLRLRNELHFHTGKSNDVFDRTEQLRVAELYGYRGSEGMLAVEELMRDYFRHTSAVRSIATSFVGAARPGSRLSSAIGALFSHRVDGDYRVTPRHIAATKSARARLQSDLGEVLRLADLANLHDKRIDDVTWRAVRDAVPHFTGELPSDTSERFLSLLSQPARLGELLRRLHELGVLEKIIPAFAHARCLLQFNEYHKYTVDEHCIRAVRRATEFFADPGPVGRVYQSIKQKRTLHLALLIHDLGKGYPGDHSDVGLTIAEDTARRLRLPLRETETLKFLVHKHLLMSHLTFRRDTSDDQLVVRFAVDVGSPEALDMLFVLTASDFAAVGPGVWNDWKAEVLTDLYRRARRHLSGDIPSMDSAERRTRRAGDVRACLAGQEDMEWFDRQIGALPGAYLHGSSPERIAADLRDLHKLRSEEIRASGRYQPESRTVEYTIGTHEQVAPGVFHRLTGALSGQGLQILSAQINTLADGLVLDRFYVLDPDYAGEPPPERLEHVKQALVNSLSAPRDEAPAFRKVWGASSRRPPSDATRPPATVRIDNSTSERFTILDIFASDRMGLLYTIARTLFELGLSVSLAKIGTYLDQVVDVFYVTDAAGNKIQDDARLHEINARLLAAIEGERGEG